MWWPRSELIALFYQLHCLAGAEVQSILTALDGPLWVDGGAHTPAVTSLSPALICLSCPAAPSGSKRERKLCAQSFCSGALSPVTHVPGEARREIRKGGEASVVKTCSTCFEEDVGRGAAANYLDVSRTPREISGQRWWGTGRCGKLR